MCNNFTISDDFLKVIFAECSKLLPPAPGPPGAKNGPAAKCGHFAAGPEKARRIPCGFAGILGAYDGKDASKTVLEASAANCAALP